LTIPTVLIADDHADLREYLADLLRARGCRVIMAESVSDALAAIASDHIHFAIIEMLLPGGGGFKVLNDYKLHGLGQAVMISANGSEDHQHYAQALGADHFLVKPFEVDDLLRLAPGGHAPQASMTAAANPSVDVVSRPA
jgi:DNA-binding response OmpR family regulator